MEKMTHEGMMEKAWILIHELGIAEKGDEAGANYVVENIYQVRDAFYADTESGHDFDGEDMPGFFARHGIAYKD